MEYVQFFLIKQKKGFLNCGMFEIWKMDIRASYVYKEVSPACGDISPDQPLKFWWEVKKENA